jgi:hypothetical protein
MKRCGIVVGTVIASALFANQQQTVVEPHDNIKLLWIEMQAVTYESAKHSSCGMAAENKPNDPFSVVCQANSEQNDIWQKKLTKVYAELQRKYGTVAFSFNPQDGTMTPYTGSVTAMPSQ